MGEAPPLQKRQIAFTFDDTPRGNGAHFTGAERTEALIAALESVDVKAWFFVTTNNIDREHNNGAARLARYVEAGHDLANHSHSHKWYRKTNIDEYIADMDTASKALKRFSSIVPYYRFPYLDQGRSIEKRDVMRQALRDRGMSNGYVTVDTYDWYMAAMYKESLRKNHKIDMDMLRDTYIGSLMQSIEFYDEISQKILGRSPKHVILLHENDLNALFIDDFAIALRKEGWEIISPNEAYTDPIAHHIPNTLYLGQGRISAIAHEKGWKPSDLVHEREDENFLRAEFLKNGLLPEE